METSSATRTKMGARNRVRPTFLYIGAGKSGSSWIYEVLREHPEVFVPNAKDIQFFDTYYDHGLDWYLSFFYPGKGKKAIGELSHNYFLSRNTAVRIREAIPDVRLMCCLREPFERTVSAYVHAQALGLDPSLSFEDFAFQPLILRAGEYFRNLQPYYDLFPGRQIQVSFFDDLRDSPRAFVHRLFKYLGVDSAFVPSCLSRKVLGAREARSRLIAHLAYRLGLVLRSMGFANVVGRVKRGSIFEALLYRGALTKPEVPLDVEQRLTEHFRNDTIKLADLIGLELPASWVTELPQ